MLKRCIAVVCAVVLLGALSPAVADVYFSRPPSAWADEELLEWTIFDTNEGDAMLLRCGGESMMVDGGPAPFRDSLCAALQQRGLTHMRYILNTHYHDDHIDGLYALFNAGFTADEYLHPYSNYKIAENDRCTRTIKAAERNGVAIRRVYHGDELTLGGAHIDILLHWDIPNQNARSLVLKVTFKDATLLLCADIIGEVQHVFAADPGPAMIDCDLMKMPHHALTPVAADFMDAVSPSAVIVTNEYDGTTRSSIQQLERRNLPALFSGDGTVYVVTNGTDWYLYQTEGEF